VPPDSTFFSALHPWVSTELACEKGKMQKRGLQTFFAMGSVMQQQHSVFI